MHIKINGNDIDQIELNDEINCVLLLGHQVEHGDEGDGNITPLGIYVDNTCTIKIIDGDVIIEN